MPSRRYCYWVIESSYGTAKATPVTGTDALYLRLSEGDGGFKAEYDPVEFDTPYGGGRSTLAETGADQFAVNWSLETLLYPTQAALLLGWGLTPINAGRTAPWTTTDAAGVMPPGDLASASVFEAVTQNDGTVEYTQWAGLKVKSGELSAGPEGDARKWRLKLSGVGSAKSASDVTHTPAPAETDYPTGPYLLSHANSGAGTLQIGAVRTQAFGATLKWDADLDAKWYTSQTIQTLLFTGRKATLDSDVRLLVSATDRADYAALTALACKLKLDNGTHTATVDMKAQNTLAKVARNWPINEVFRTSLSVKNRWDATAATDLTAAAT